MRYAGFLVGAERFDNAFFSVSTGESSWMDPHQRLVLELGYTALHDGRMRRIVPLLVPAAEAPDAAVRVRVEYAFDMEPRDRYGDLTADA